MSHRTQIILTDDQYELLRHESERTGAGLGELVRRAIDRSYGSRDGSLLLAALDESFGAWKGRDFDGEAYVDRIRPGLAIRLAR